MRFLLQYCKIKALTDENSHYLYTLIYTLVRRINMYAIFILKVEKKV